MLFRRVLVTLAALLLLLAPIPPVWAQSQIGPVSAEERLLGAMKFWGDVKLFDPQASDGSVDWDAAFMNAEPAILAATDRKAYIAALDSLILPLHDPATHVEDETPAGQGRTTVSSIGAVTVVTIPHGVSPDRAAADAVAAIPAAAKSNYVLFDIRGVTEANDGDAAALGFLFSAGSPVLQLVKGDVTLPRERLRTYYGYPNQAGSETTYSANDQLSDPQTLHGKSQMVRRFGFLVDASTSLPPLAIALARKGDASIYSTGGQPSVLSTDSASMSLPYGVTVTYRTSDLADFSSHQQFAQATVRGPQDAADNLRSQPPRIPNYAGPPALRLADSPYATAGFPSEAMRMLAVARVFNVIRYFSPYTALMHDDWDAAARSAIDDERAAGDARAYVLALLKFYAHLHDSHGGFPWSPTIEREFGAGPPFSARYLHGQVVVDELYASGVNARGLRIGDVIDAVDGTPARQAMNRIEQYICASTLQSADSAALRAHGDPSIFSGPAQTSVNLRFHHPGSRTATAATFVRGFGGGGGAKGGPKFMVLPGNVGYVDFDRLLPSEVDAMFAALKNTRAIVFDNRGYPHGAAWPIAPRLTAADSVRAALFDIPLVLGSIDPSGDIVTLPAYQRAYQLLPTTSGTRYLKPTVMLIDERAISQSEHSALFFYAANHTRFVGTPTTGANGDVTAMILPGSLRLSFSGLGVRYADGRQLQRVGVVPNVRVEPTAADIARENDVVLQRGLDEALRLSGAGAQTRKAAVEREIARERTALTAPPIMAGPEVRGTGEKPLALAWTVSNRSYSGSVNPSGGYMNAPELTLQSVATSASTPYGSYASALDLTTYLGKTIRIRGYLRAENVNGGEGFWLRIDGPSSQVDNMQNRWLTGTTEWKPFTIILHVGDDATGAYAGLLLVGTGRASASALKIDIVPDSTPTTGF